MISRACLSLILASGVVAFSLGDAAAQGAPAGVQPQPIGAFKDWNAYAAPVKGGKICYALATPEKGRRSAQAPSGAYFFISNRPLENIVNEVSVTPGFPLKAGSTVKVRIDRTAFDLFVRGDGAFMNSNEEQTKLVEAMRGGSSMRIEGVSTRGRSSTQNYSLSGIAAALDKINQECRGAARAR